jgi:hypothetical protein
MTTPWREMPEFAGIDLEDSRIIGWRTEHGRLVVDLELRLLPDHPAYTPPLFGEPGCDRPAQLVFDTVRKVDGLHPPLSAFTDDRDGPPRVDTLAWLRREDDGSFHFDAVWGTIRVHAEALRLDLEEVHRVAA